jgi:anti-sigma regulatory factor (Ser/Thr protein kinase)
LSLETEALVIGRRDHVVQFYARDEELVATVGDYLLDAIQDGDAAVVIATEAHRRAFEVRLNAAGVDVADAQGRGALVFLDAAETLSRFMVDGSPDPNAFESIIGDCLSDAAEHARRVRAYGEMVALLWDDGQVAAALELEALWNNLGATLQFSLFCAYPMQSVTDEHRALAFNQVCHLHSFVVGDPTAAATVDAPRDDARTFPRNSGGASAARRFVLETLARWGREDLSDDAAIVVTELASNALRHAQSAFTVAVSQRQGSIRVSVRDASFRLPVERDAPLSAASGRGLHIVAGTASRWGTDLVGDGKVVWAELGP